MKPLILLLLTVNMVFTATAQNNAVTNIDLQQKKDRSLLAFTVAKEVNVKYYRIEAANDSEHFNVVATIKPKSNSVLKADYSYDVSAYGYTHYRVAVVGMNGTMPYSDIVLKQPTKTKPLNNYPQDFNSGNDVLTAR